MSPHCFLQGNGLPSPRRFPLMRKGWVSPTPVPASETKIKVSFYSNHRQPFKYGTDVKFWVLRFGSCTVRFWSGVCCPQENSCSAHSVCLIKSPKKARAKLSEYGIGPEEVQAPTEAFSCDMLQQFESADDQFNIGLILHGHGLREMAINRVEEYRHSRAATRA